MNGPAKLFRNITGRRCALAGDPAARPAREPAGAGSGRTRALARWPRPVQSGHHRRGIRVFERSPGPVRTGLEPGRGERRDSLAGRSVSSGSPTSRPTALSMSWKKSSHDGMDAGGMVLIFCFRARVGCGAAPASPGHAAYEKANRLLVAKKLPEALAAVDEALRLDPKLVPALTLKAKLAMAAYRLDVAQQCLEQALALDPQRAVCPVPLWARGVSGKRLERGFAALPKGPSTESRRSARGPVSRPHGREPGTAGAGLVSLRRGCPAGTRGRRIACGDAVARRQTPAAHGPPGGMRALDRARP